MHLKTQVLFVLPNHLGILRLPSKTDGAILPELDVERGSLISDIHSVFRKKKRKKKELLKELLNKTFS